MSLGDYKSMQKEPGGPADAPGHVGMSVAELESECERLRADIKSLQAALMGDNEGALMLSDAAETIQELRSDIASARKVIDRLREKLSDAQKATYRLIGYAGHKYMACNSLSCICGLQAILDERLAQTPK